MGSDDEVCILDGELAGRCIGSGDLAESGAATWEAGSSSMAILLLPRPRNSPWKGALPLRLAGLPGIRLDSDGVSTLC